MLIKHIRDDYAVPYATIVALDPNHIGVSVCHDKDQFDKKRGIKIAKGRAVQPRCYSDWFQANIPVHIPEFKIVYQSQLHTFFDVLSVEVEAMRKRAERYYK